MPDIPIYETKRIILKSMKNEKYFILVSIIAVFSLGYITFINMVNLGLVDNKYQYATVVSSIPSVLSTTSSQISTSTKFSLPPESPVNYTDNKNGTITDNYTSLIWKKCPQGMSGNDCKNGSPSYRILSESQTECSKLNFAGKVGWRLPTLKELQSIVDTGTYDPSINKNFFSGTDDPYWTDTAPAAYPVSRFTVIFSEGSVYYVDMNSVAATRCVYDGNVKK